MGSFRSTQLPSVHRLNHLAHIPFWIIACKGISYKALGDANDDASVFSEQCFAVSTQLNDSAVELKSARREYSRGSNDKIKTRMNNRLSIGKYTIRAKRQEQCFNDSHPLPVMIVVTAASVCSTNSTRSWTFCFLRIPCIPFRSCTGWFAFSMMNKLVVCLQAPPQSFLPPPST